MRMTKILFAAAAFSMVAPAAFASSAVAPISSFTDAKTGFRVVTRSMSGGDLLLIGKHPETGENFRLKVRTSGAVKGELNGQPVEFSVPEEKLKAATSL
ncbi:hypothetical protein [Parapedomonas caeni]